MGAVSTPRPRVTLDHHAPALHLLLAAATATAVLVLSVFQGVQVIAQERTGRLLPPAAATRAALADPDVMRYLYTHPDKTLGTADPCRPLTYTYDPETTPVEWQRVIHDAADRASDASGIKFQHIPSSLVDPSALDRDSRGRGSVLADGPTAPAPPLLIALATEADEPRLEQTRVAEGYETIAGLYGRDFVLTATGEQVISSGLIVINLDATRYPLDDLGGLAVPETVDARMYAESVNTVLHEFGHALGIRHPKTRPGSLMWADETRDGELDWYDKKLFAAAGSRPC